MGLEDAARKHEDLKKRIHSFRIPIRSRAGRFLMGCIYFTTPLVVGYNVMRASDWIRDRNLGGDERREKLVEAKRRWEEGQKPLVRATMAGDHAAAAAAAAAARQPRVVEKTKEL